MSWETLLLSWETLLYITVFILLLTLAVDSLQPFSFFKEGFMVGVGDNPFLSAYFPRRGDVSFNADESVYIQM